MDQFSLKHNKFSTEIIKELLLFKYNIKFYTQFYISELFKNFVTYR
jgi:hypothetical protein